MSGWIDEWFIYSIRKKCQNKEEAKNVKWIGTGNLKKVWRKVVEEENIFIKFFFVLYWFDERKFVREWYLISRGEDKLFWQFDWRNVKKVFVFDEFLRIFLRLNSFTFWCVNSFNSTYLMCKIQFYVRIWCVNC